MGIFVKNPENPAATTFSLLAPPLKKMAARDGFRAASRPNRMIDTLMALPVALKMLPPVVTIDALSF
jgi:hypothetical protein